MKANRNNQLRKCPHCGAMYSLGWNGVKGTCDACAGIQRTKTGNAWRSWETEHIYIPIDAALDDPTAEIKITRAEAFAK